VSDPLVAFWLLLVKVPLAVIITWYSIFFVGRYDPGSTAGACFSALYVCIAQYIYEPLADVIPPVAYGLIAHTIIVRVLAISTALIVAHIFNVLVSAPGNILLLFLLILRKKIF
jgi:hypothetical protein